MGAGGGAGIVCLTFTGRPLYSALLMASEGTKGRGSRHYLPRAYPDAFRNAMRKPEGRLRVLGTF